MTVITPYQRQLVFTRTLTDKPASRRQTGLSAQAGWLRWLDWQELVEDGLAARLLAFSLVLSFAGLLYFGIDAVLLSFRIKTVSGILEQSRVERESLEIRKAQLLSLEALKDYASMVQLSQAQRISYLLGSSSDLAHAAEVARSNSAQ